MRTELKRHRRLFFPRQARPPEMSVVGRLSVNWAQEIEPFYHRSGPEIERLHIFRNCALITSPECVDHGRNFPCHSDRVGNLNLYSLRETLANDVASNIAAEISATAIYLGWVFSAESATSVPSSSSVSVHDDFSARYTAVG